LKHEIIGEPTPIAPDRLIQNFCRDVVQSSEINIEQDFLAPNVADPSRDLLNCNDFLIHRGDSQESSRVI
jgi:hypothetical protein